MSEDNPRGASKDEVNLMEVIYGYRDTIESQIGNQVKHHKDEHALGHKLRKNTMQAYLTGAGASYVMGNAKQGNALGLITLAVGVFDVIQSLSHSHTEKKWNKRFKKIAQAIESFNTKPTVKARDKVDKLVGQQEEGMLYNAKMSYFSDRIGVLGTGAGILTATVATSGYALGLLPAIWPLGKNIKNMAERNDRDTKNDGALKQFGKTRDELFDIMNARLDITPPASGPGGP